jgi:hypothetical protein
MAGAKSGPKLTLSDSDMITKRVYGRRILLRRLGAALLGAGAMTAGTVTAARASCDADQREVGDGQDHFADSNFRDPKSGC